MSPKPATRTALVRAGLRTDLDAVTAGLTLDASSGPVEGTVNRIKMIKRQMFGRAKSTYYVGESSTLHDHRAPSITECVPEPISDVSA